MAIVIFMDTSVDQQQRLPQTFIDYVAEIIPEHLNIDDFISACNRPLRKSIRVNTLKISVAAFTESVARKGWTLEPVPWCESGFWLTRPNEEEEKLPLGNTAEHLLGLFYIQEASSMMPPNALLGHLPIESDEPLSILDMAAAPGSKTTQLAELVSNSGFIIANEFSSSRLKVLNANIQRLGINNTAMTHFDGRVYSHLAERFDYVLIDAPCSGEGTVRKDADAMKDWTIEHVHEIANTQQGLIEAAFQALKVGGRLVYSTCTVNPIENQEVCLNLQQKFPDALRFVSLADSFSGASSATTEQGFLHIWPQIYDSEGFFVACIEKTESIELNPLTPNYKVKPFPFRYAKRSECEDFIEYLSSMGLPAYRDDKTLYVRDNEYWLFPNEIDVFKKLVKFDRVGVKAAELHRKGFRLQHNLVMSLHFEELTESYELSRADLKSWFQGRDIALAERVKKIGDVIVTFEGAIAGCGRWQNNKIKNGLPRELVRDSKLIDY